MSEPQIDLYAHNAYEIFRQADMLETARQQFKNLRKRVLKRTERAAYSLAKIYEVLGLIYLKMSRTKVADWCIAQLVCLQQETSPNDLIDYLSMIGDEYEKEEIYGRTLYWYGQVLALAKGSGLRQIESGMLYNIGNVYAALEQWNEAKNSYLVAQTVARQIADLELEDRITHNLGYLAREQGDFENAIVLLKQSLDLSRQRQDVDGISYNT